MPLPTPGPPPATRSEAVRRVLKHLERKRIGELREGEAAVIIGNVAAVDGIAWLEAPMSGDRCIGYHLRARQNNIDLFHEVPQLYDEARCVAFTISDHTGVIEVDSAGLDLAITTATRRQLFWPPHPPAVLARMPAYAAWPLLFEEGQLRPNMRAAVCGLVVSELWSDDYRNGKSRLVLRASTTFPLVASTDADLFADPDSPIAPIDLYER